MVRAPGVSSRTTAVSAPPSPTIAGAAGERHVHRGHVVRRDERRRPEVEAVAETRERRILTRDGLDTADAKGSRLDVLVLVDRDPERRVAKHLAERCGLRDVTGAALGREPRLGRRPGTEAEIADRDRGRRAVATDGVETQPHPPALAGARQRHALLVPLLSGRDRLRIARRVGRDAEDRRREHDPGSRPANEQAPGELAGLALGRHVEREGRREREGEPLVVGERDGSDREGATLGPQTLHPRQETGGSFVSDLRYGRASARSSNPSGRAVTMKRTPARSSTGEVAASARSGSTVKWITRSQKLTRRVKNA